MNVGIAREIDVSLVGKFITYSDFESTMSQLMARIRWAQKAELAEWDGVIGVAWSGLPVAVHVAKNLGLPMDIMRPQKNTCWLPRRTFYRPLVVDDFYDTGKTSKIVHKTLTQHNSRLSLNRLNYAFAYSRDPKVHLFGTLISEEIWLHFPWDKVYNSNKEETKNV